MNKKQLAKATLIDKKIEKCKNNIQALEYTQLEGVLPRETYLTFNGTVDSIEIPETLFRVIGKIILSEYQVKLIELQKEFDSI